MLSPTALASSETESGNLTQLASRTVLIQSLPYVSSPARMSPL
jgi:hypothetical protein